MPRSRRFPRYAPEPLERRLNPSAIVSPTSTCPVPADTTATTIEPGDPPIAEPTSPVGPALPA